MHCKHSKNGDFSADLAFPAGEYFAVILSVVEDTILYPYKNTQEKKVYRHLMETLHNANNGNNPKIL